MTTTAPVAPTAASTAVLRFAVTGLRAATDSYLAGDLPLHRFAWELRIRVDALAELTPPTRTLTRLRWLQRTVEHLHLRLATGGRTGDEESSLTDAVTVLWTLLAGITPLDPGGPAGAARPSAPVSFRSASQLTSPMSTTPLTLGRTPA